MPKLPQSRRLRWVLFTFSLASVLVTVGTIGGPMPLRRTAHPLAPLTSSELHSRTRIRTHIHTLAGTIGGRNAVRYEGLRRAIEYIERELRAYGYSPQRQSFSVDGQD